VNLYFVFIGPQRTGTTWIYEHLKNHSQLCFPKEVKETMFFDRYYEKELDWYFWHFRQKTEKQLAGEVAPTYFDEEKVPERIHSVNSDCRIFITLRHPVERARSLFHHHLRKGRVTGDFSMAVEEMPRIITAGRYEKHIQRWLNTFGKNNIHFILLDDIKKEPSETLNLITTALDISSISLSKDEKNKVNAATMPNNMLFAKYGAKLAIFLRSKRLHKSVEIGKKLGLKRIFSGNETKLPELSISEKKMLLKKYEEDIRFVEQFLNRNLSNWRDI
jgi:hypothetical protein